jgi:hypothetical protein
MVLGFMVFQQIGFGGWSTLQLHLKNSTGSFTYIYISILVVYRSWYIHSWIVCFFLLRNLTSLSLNFYVCLNESVCISIGRFWC